MGWVPAALAAFLGFSALIMLHELGHFAAAKAVGMRVEKFSLFFGPMLVKVRRGDTVYGVGPIPLGGYVKISGMNPHEKLPPEVEPRAYFRQPVWKPEEVVGAGPVARPLEALDPAPVRHFSDLYRADAAARETARSLVDGVDAWATSSRSWAS